MIVSTQGLKIDLKATIIVCKKKFAKLAFFHNFATFQVNKCPRYGQMETGLKSIVGQQSSGQYSLTSHKNFTQPNHPLQGKNLKVSIFLQFCFISGEQLSTLCANGDYGLKSTLGQQSSGQYSLTSQKNFTQPNHPLQEKIR